MAALPTWSWEDKFYERRRDEEALRNVCWSILDRTIRDLFTYKDRRTKKRAHHYKTAFNWLFQYDPDDSQVPMSFTYVCGILDLDSEALAKAVWDSRHLTFQELKEEMKRQERARVERVQRRREDDDYSGSGSGKFEFSIGPSWAP